MQPRAAHNSPNTLAGALFGAVIGIAGIFAASSMIGAAQPSQPATQPTAYPTAQDSSAQRATDREPEIRVRILRDADKIRVEGVTEQRLIIRPPAGGKGELVTGPLTVEPAGRAIAVTDASGTRRTYTPRTLRGGIVSGLEIAPREAIVEDNLRRVRVDGVDHPGHIRIHLERDSSRRPALDAIAVMPIEQYIPGVIAKELYQKWPRATFQAQAVAARSYALHQRERSRSKNRTYDVESTTRDQVFGGATQLRTAVSAASSTKGIVLTDRGDLLRTYYSSTCGGTPAAAADTFPTGSAYKFNLAPPIQAYQRVCPCQDAPRYRWTRSRPKANLAERLRSWGARANMNLAQLGQIKDIAIEITNDVGRPKLYRIDDDLGRTYFVPAETFRVASNFNAPGLPQITSQTRVSSSHFEIDLLGAEAHFRGQGFGHGVGMCQWGAKALADINWDWRRILEHYYPDATISRAY